MRSWWKDDHPSQTHSCHLHQWRGTGHLDQTWENGEGLQREVIFSWLNTKHIHSKLQAKLFVVSLALTFYLPNTSCLNPWQKYFCSHIILTLSTLNTLHPKSLAKKIILLRLTFYPRAVKHITSRNPGRNVLILTDFQIDWLINWLL